MPRMLINVIDHRDGDQQPRGEIIQPYMVYGYEEPGRKYADFCALFNNWIGWSQHGDPPEIIGFFGYRKYMVFDPIKGATSAHAPNWWQCNRNAFDEYRVWLALWDGGEIKRLLAQYDILQAQHYPLGPKMSICEDFAVSRSKHDEELLYNAACAYFAKVHTVHKIYPYLFITRWSVFDRMMREIEPLRQELHGKCVGVDSRDEEYKKRPMAYVMERVYSLWLENSGLSIKEMPFLHCWEMHA